MLRMMLRPRWVLALLAALAVAAVFALLSQWQLGRAVEQATVVERDTETVLPFAGVAQPDEPTDQIATGQRVAVAGEWVPGDTVLVQSRLNGGRAGWWVVAHVEVGGDAAPGGMPVALGWAGTESQAQDAAAAFDAALRDASSGSGSDDAVIAPGEVELVGRFLPSEAPELADAEAGIRTTVAVADLVNAWAGYDDRPAYFGYVTLAEAPLGLDVIDSPRPEDQAELNWLNIFYAIEWVVLGGFAVFLWWRLVKDAVEREEQAAEEAAGSGHAAS